MIRVYGQIDRTTPFARRCRPVFGVLVIALSWVMPASADEPLKPEAKPAKIEAEAKSVLLRAPSSTDAQQYCVNITGAAIDARYTWQAKKLGELEEQIKTRIAELEAKQAEYKDWIERREALAKKAEDNLVGVYAHMKPEVAAAQLAALDDDMAAAILGQLNARAASAILNEFQPEHAARLANVMAGRPVQTPDGKKL